MKLKNILTKISFIFTILITILILFHVAEIDEVRAEETHSSKLSKLEVIGYENDLNPEFDPNIYEYNITIKSNDIDLLFNLECQDNEAITIIKNNRHIKSNSGEIQIIVMEPYSDDSIYKINYNKVEPNKEYLFSYTGSMKEFEIPVASEYKIELWGAQGANSKYNGGLGAYTSGKIKLNGKQKIYVYVGGQGTTTTSAIGGAGYNGGGNTAYTSNIVASGGGGGGSTDIRIQNGEWDDFESLKSRIMVAAGGGGGSYSTSSYNVNAIGGAAGGLSGYSGLRDTRISYGSLTTGGTQTTGGLKSGCGNGYCGKNTSGIFGKGGEAAPTSSGWWPGGAGGAGYYGGGGGASGYVFGGAGGSSFISGHNGCDAIDETSIENNIIHTGQSIHYSGLSFTETQMIDGQGYAWTETKENLIKQPTHDGIDEQIGNSGNGYAKITTLDLLNNDNYLETLEYNHGNLTPMFSPTEFEYDLILDKFDLSVTLNGVLSNDLSKVTGLGKYNIEPGQTKNVDITVVSESGNIKIYKIRIYREKIGLSEHLSKISKLAIRNFETDIEPEFHPLTYDYNISIPSSYYELNIDIDLFDEEATYNIEGNKYLIDENGVITITVIEPNVEKTIYRIFYKKIEVSDFSTYDYTGFAQKYLVPISGKYKIELWGAKGANSKYEGGNGAYTSGNIYLNRNQILYIFVGGQGNTTTSFTGGGSGYNGGGLTYYSPGYGGSGGAGGGSTDIRIQNGEWDDFESLKSRIMVAAGGGGGSYSISSYNVNSKGGAGGGLIGYSGLRDNRLSYGAVATGGTQTTGGLKSYCETNYCSDNEDGKFGQGGKTASVPSNNWWPGAGGGSGYYGGGGGASGYVFGGAGGSSFISGHNGCDAIDETSTESNIIHTGQSIHYSGLSFTETQMIDGQGYEWTTEKGNLINQPTYDGTGTMVGNASNGYAKISLLKMLSQDNYLTTILTTNPKTGETYELNPSFDPTIEEYNITLGVNDTKIKIGARPSSDLAIIEGLGEYDVFAGTTIYPIVVTAESGDIRTYNINVTRESSSESKANDIIITGLVPSICDGYIGYCKLDTEFDENKNTYYMTVPSGIRELEFTADKKHDYQSIVGEGVTRLSGGDNIVTIEITSEDGKNISVYSFEITRDMTGNNYIDNIEFINPELDIGFNYLLTEYSFKVDNEVTNLDMNITLDDENASYVVKGNENFVVGNNVVEIEVTAANGEVRSYILNVYRVSNSNALLENLEVINEDTIYTLSPEFVDIKTNYTLNVENEVEKVVVNASAQATTTTVSGTGEYILKTGLNQIKVITTAEDGSIETYTIIITRDKNSNNYLSVLEASEGLFNETFEKETESYTMTVDPYTKSLTLTATAEVSTSKVSISGNSNFKIGENLVTVTVTAENGDIRKYYITVTKEGSDINYLSSLSVNEGELTPVFNKEILEYKIEIENDIKNITISGEKEDSLSKVSGFGTYKLTTGENKITVRVTSETGKTRDYVINVFRKYNDDSNLKSITISNGTLSPSFDKDVLEYTVNVENEIEKITVKGVPFVNTTTVEGNNTYSLNTGNNEIILNVTSESGIIKTYKINVIRDISRNANLSYLMIKEGSLIPTFNKMTVNYKVKVLNEVEKVNVLYTPEKETSIVNITGTDSLVIGENIVNVIVTAEDGSIKTYEIIVERQEKNDINLNLKTLDVTSCALSPEFTSDIQYYECDVPYEVSSVTASASLEDETNTLSGTGTYKLNIGRNIINIKVINSELYEKDYQVVVTRKESTESRLNNIRVENHVLNETFDKDKYNYSLSTEDDNLIFKIDKLHENQEIEIIGNENYILGENIVQIKVTSPDKSNISVYEITITKEKSSNNYLSNLWVEDYEISSKFSKGIMEYNLTVENEVLSIIVNATPENMNSGISGIGMHNLNKGENVITVRVMSESGVLREYNINVTRLGSRNNNLSNLKVENYNINPEFNSEILDYELEVEYSVSEINILADAEEENAIIMGDGITSLDKGINYKKIIVTSENGEVKTYTLKITRKDPVTSLLENIEVKNYNLDKIFDPNETNYIVVVDNEVESLELLISKLDPNSTYVVEGNENFIVGLNEVKIISTSSDGIDTTTYTLTVNRQSYSNTYLNALSVSEGTLSPEFNKTTLSYEVIVNNEIEKVVISASAENITSTVSGIGEKTLKVGENKFDITVTSTGGIIRTYKVKIIRKGSNNANILKITSNIGSIEKQNETSYKLVVPNTVLEIKEENIIVTTEDEKAVVEKEGTINLNEDKEYLIKVTSPDKSVIKEYKIYVEYELSSDTTLKELASNLGTMTPEFNPNIYKYTIDVLDTVNEIELIAVVNDEKSTILNDSLVYSLTEYETNIDISVQAEDGSIKIYTVNVVKSITTELYLQNIEITGIKDICVDCIIPTYNETTYVYDLTVPNEVKEIGYIFTKKHQSQQIKVFKNDEEVSKYELSVGVNTFDIEVENSIGDKTIYTYNIERLKSDNNYLLSLKLTTPEVILDDFDREKLEYSVKIPYEYENIFVEAIPEDELNAKVNMRGTTYLLEGNNDVIITVTAENKEKREYIIHVLRTPESNNLLKTLTISSGDIYQLSPKFMPGITDYTLTVSSLISKVSIEGLADDENSTVVGNGEYDLTVGLNEVVIKVINSDNQEKDYKITITRESSKNVYLSSITINNGTMSPEFQKENDLYSVEVENTENKLDLNVIVEDPNASYEIIGNENLRFGKNTILIKVTSSDKSASRTYILEVNKKGEDNNNLSSLMVDGNLIQEFDPLVTEYNLEVENIKTSVVIDAKAESEYAKVSGIGVYSLNEGLNEIKVKVTSQSSVEKTYTINIIRKLNAYLSAIVTDEGTVNPTFDKEILEYSIEVENSVKEITVIGLKDSIDADVIGNGKYSLNVGRNEIILKVINGIYEKEYKLIVIRKGSDNTYLEYLTIAEGQINPIFNKEIMEYTVYIPDDKTSITLDYKPEDETSTVEVIGNENLLNKENEIVVRVTSTSTLVRDYIIKVIREDASLYSNKLTSLSVNKGTMSPKFDPDVNEYTVTVPNSISEITVSAIRESVEAIVIGTGSHKLVVGRNIIQVLVLSKDNKQRIYTLIVYRNDSSDARLSELEFNEGYLNPIFNKNIYEYTLVTESDAKFITIKNIKAVEDNATIEITKTSEEVKTGNIININVTSPDGKTTNTYKVTLLVEKSSNANLSELSVNVGELKPVFEKGTYVYKVDVENSVKSIIINAKAESEKGAVSGTGLYNLNTGENVIHITVTSESGISNVYSVVVTRAKSSNNNLKDLYVRGYTFDKVFDKNILEYNLEVENSIDKIILEGEKEDESAEVIGLKEYILTEGLNELKVIVTAEDGSIKTYRVNVIKKEIISSKIKSLYVLEGELTPEFTSETYEYYVNIPNEYTSITPIIELEEKNASYEIIGNENLKVGKNKVQIKVTSSIGDITTYVLNVIKNISSNNYLSVIEVDKGTLSPSFNKETLNYEVTVYNNEDTITVNALPELSSTIVIGIGTYNLKVGENIVTLKAISESGIERIYKVKVTREAKDNNYLSNIIVSNGNLDKSFDKEVLDYEVVVEEGLEEIEITGIKEDETSTIEGNGIHKLKAGENNISIIVTSEAGNIRIYNIIVNRPIGTSTGILNITPSSGTLSPEFNDDISKYNITIDKGVNVMNFDVELESKTAKVTGNKNIVIEEKETKVVLTVTAEDGNTRKVIILVNKDSLLERIELEKTNIILPKDEVYQVVARVYPDDRDNIKYNYTTNNDEIISIDENGLIRAKSTGEAVVTVKVDGEELESQMLVTVVENRIKSSVYNVVDKKSERIIIGMNEGITLKDFVDNLMNEESAIKIYDKEENLLTDMNEIVKTGLVVKLEIDEKVYDTVIMIVRGDINEDGIIDVSDKVKLVNHILLKDELTDYRIYACDLVVDDIVDVSDKVRLVNYILKKITSLN